MTKYEPTTKYLAIKDWDKIKAGKDRKGRQIKAWVKDYVTKDFDDPAYSRLTLFQRGLFDAICRACARSGAGAIQNDSRHIAGATHTTGWDAAHLEHGLGRLVQEGLLIPTNQQFASSDSETQSDSETETETKAHVAPLVSGASPLPSGEEKPTPSGPSTERQTNTNTKKGCGCADGLCDWSEPVAGLSHPSSLGDAVYYQRHVKRNDYFIAKLSRGYVLKEWKRILADTPEGWEYDPDPMIKERTIPLDGRETYIGKEIVRRPKNAKERALLLKFGADQNRKWLYDPNCPAKCSEGLVFEPDYPDAIGPERMMGQNATCACVTKETV